MINLFHPSITINVGHAEITYRDLSPVNMEGEYGELPLRLAMAFTACLAAARLDQMKTLADCIQSADHHEGLYLKDAHTSMVKASWEYLDAVERSEKDTQALREAQVAAKQRAATPRPADAAENVA